MTAILVEGSINRTDGRGRKRLDHSIRTVKWNEKERVYIMAIQIGDAVEATSIPAKLAKGPTEEQIEVNNIVQKAVEVKGKFLKLTMAAGDDRRSLLLRLSHAGKRLGVGNKEDATKLEFRSDPVNESIVYVGVVDVKKTEAKTESPAAAAGSANGK